MLLKRSIFARDGRPSTRTPGAAAGAHAVPGQWVGPPGTEATLVFRGVTLTDGSYSAYIEDITGGGVRRFSRGEEIAAGRIAGISLNGMDYESGPFDGLGAGPKMTRIVLGQNLAGANAPPPPPPTTAPASAPPPPDGNPRGPGRGRPPGFPPGGPPGPAGAEPPGPVAPQ